MSDNVGETPRWRQDAFAGRRIERVVVCVLCLQPIDFGDLCPRCESAGDLYGSDWRDS